MNSNIPTLSVKKPTNTTSKLVRPLTIQRPFQSRIPASTNKLPTLSGIKRPASNALHNDHSVSKFKRTTPLTLMRQTKIPKTVAKNPDITRLDFSDSIKTSMTNKKSSISSFRALTVAKPLKISIDNSEKPTYETKSTSPIVDWNSMTKDSEIISFRVKISVLQKQVEELNFKNSKIRIENEINESKMRNENEEKSKKIKELNDETCLLKEDNKELMGKCEELKNENLEQTNLFEKQKFDYESTINKLKLEIMQTKSEEENIRSKMLSDGIFSQHRIDELENELKKCKSEIEIYNLNSKEFNLKENEFELLRVELTNSKNQIRKLNDQIESYKEGFKLQDILKDEIGQLKHIKDENNHLKNQVELLNGVNEDNLILKEKIIGFQDEIENLKSIINQKSVDQAELNHTKNRIAEWIQIIGFDSPDIVVNQILELKQNISMLRVENDSLKSQIHLANENNSFCNFSSKSTEIELKDSKKKVEQLSDSLKKLNRKCLLISKEKESYKRIINSNESETTINDDSVNRNRISELEAIIEDYKVLMSQQELDIKKEQEDCETNCEKDRQIEQLQNELKHIKELNPHIYTNMSLDDSNLKTNNELNYRVIHLKDNPMSQKVNEYIEQHNNMEEEISRLKMLIEIVESGNLADMTRQIDEGIKYQQEVEKLKKTLKTQEKTHTLTLETFKRISKSFRQTCFYLTGFRIDNCSNNQYRLMHAYAPTKEQLIFEVDPTKKAIQLLENNAASNLQDIIQLYLNEHDSYPAFLAAYTLQLFNSRKIV